MMTSTPHKRPQACRQRPVRVSVPPQPVVLLSFNSTVTMALVGVCVWLAVGRVWAVGGWAVDG